MDAGKFSQAAQALAQLKSKWLAAQQARVCLLLTVTALLTILGYTLTQFGDAEFAYFHYSTQVYVSLLSTRSTRDTYYTATLTRYSVVGLLPTLQAHGVSANEESVRGVDEATEALQESVGAARELLASGGAD